tara:strand:+ start:255 stop:851 length:597 start_codon:yes stop_codon:yes gene_type:complete
MKLKSYSSSIFEKNVPGKALASIKNQAKFSGQLYSFAYTSLGPAWQKQQIKLADKLLTKEKARGKKIRKGLRARATKKLKQKFRSSDPYPLLFLAYKNGQRTWRAKNGKSYIYGFNLNYLPETERLQFIRDLQKTVGQGGLKVWSYDDMMALFNLPTSEQNTIFRKYDVRGSKMRRLKAVNLDTYEGYLSSHITNARD